MKELRLRENTNCNLVLDNMVTYTTSQYFERKKNGVRRFEVDLLSNGKYRLILWKKEEQGYGETIYFEELAEINKLLEYMLNYTIVEDK